MIERDRRKVERRIKAAKFPVVKSLDSFDFAAIPKLNKMQVLELARCEWIERRENVIALGPSGTGKTHIALALGLAACQKGLSVVLRTHSNPARKPVQALSKNYVFHSGPTSTDDAVERWLGLSEQFRACHSA